MKQRQNARQRREAEEKRRKGVFFPGTAESSSRPAEPPAAPQPVIRPADANPSRTPEEEAREFMDYLDRYGTPAVKDDVPETVGKKPGVSGTIPCLNLEEGMPVVCEAIDRMHIGLQEMRCSRVRAVKLIHGYGSSGRGGRIRAGVREELVSMKRKKIIRDYIPGEDFGPLDAASRKLAEQQKSTTRDPDYGRINPGITIVIL